MNEITQTMSSVDLVALINEIRKQENPESATLAHYDFLKKIRIVLGEVGAGKFSGSYKDSGGKQNPCYYLPKREACLMVMSESYKVQAAVYDRMTELETSTSNSKLESLARALNLLGISDELKAKSLVDAVRAGNSAAELTRTNPNPSKINIGNNSLGTNFLQQLTDDNSLGTNFLQQVLEIYPCSGLEIRKGKLLVNLELAMRELPNEAYWRENRMKLSASLQKMDTFIKYRTDTINGRQAASYIFAV